MSEEVHVVPHGNTWRIAGLNNDFTTQEEAEQAGRSLARERKSEFVLHGKDGRIQMKDSYGNDPREIPG